MSRIGDNLNYAKGTAVEIWHAGKDEVQEAPLNKKLMLGAAATGFAFEWGTGNEALMGMVGGTVLKHTNDALLTAASTGGASFVEQTTIGMATVISIHNFPKFMNTIRERIEGRKEKAAGTDANIGQSVDVPQGKNSVGGSESNASKIGSRFLLAFGLGTSIVAMGNNATQDRSLKENSKNVVIDAGLIGTGVATIGAAVWGVTNLGRATGLNTEANIFVDVLKFPGTWLTLAGTKLVSMVTKNPDERDEHMTTVEPTAQAQTENA